MKYLLITVLAVAVFISALEVIISQHQSRKLFIEIQELEKTHDELNILWGQLQIEQSTYATDNRIEILSIEKLGMIEPGIEEINLLIQ